MLSSLNNSIEYLKSFIFTPTPSNAAEPAEHKTPEITTTSETTTPTSTGWTNLSLNTTPQPNDQQFEATEETVDPIVPIPTQLDQEIPQETIPSPTGSSNASSRPDTPRPPALTVNTHFDPEEIEQKNISELALSPIQSSSPSELSKSPRPRSCSSLSIYEELAKQLHKMLDQKNPPKTLPSIYFGKKTNRMIHNELKRKGGFDGDTTLGKESFRNAIGFYHREPYRNWVKERTKQAATLELEQGEKLRHSI